MRARAVAQLDQAAAETLAIEADIRHFNELHPDTPVEIPTRPAWLTRLLEGNANA
jgi:hypothetical protein